MALSHFLKKTHAKFKEVTDKVASFRQTQDAHHAGHEHTVGPNEPPAQKIEFTVSAATIAKIVVLTIIFIALASFVSHISDIIVVFFISLLFAAALDPMVDFLQARRIPRALGVLVIYLVLFGFIGLLISNVIPVVATELAQIAVRAQELITKVVSGEVQLPSLLERFRPAIKNAFEGLDVSQIDDYKDFLLKLADKLSGVAGNVFNAVVAIFNGLFNTILVFVITFLMTVDEAAIDNFILSLFSARHADYIKHKSAIIKEKMGYWLRGQVVLCVAVGALVYLGLLLLGIFGAKVEYAATIALVAGFTELIPYAGPFIAWLIALPIIANQSLILIVWVTILMYVVQALENNVLVPLVMHKAVGISAIFVMFAMLVGFAFQGVLGMVLAVPVATVAALFVKDYAEKTK